MGLFSRLGALLKSNLNDLISKAEDPEKMLNQVLVDMKTQLVEAKKQVAVAIGDEKRLKKQWDEQVASTKDWERKAMLAVQQGDDELAKEALTRSKEHEELSAQFEGQWIQQKEAVEKLKGHLRVLNNKIEEAKRKRNILVSRQKRAQAQATINKTLAQLNSTDSHDSTFARMDERVTQLEAEAEASMELGAAPEHSLESQFKALEAGSTVDAELEALKQRMALGSGGGPRAAIGSGKDARAPEPEPEPEPDLEPGDDDLRAAEVDAQLEELKRKLSGG